MFNLKLLISAAMFVAASSASAFDAHAIIHGFQAAKQALHQKTLDKQSADFGDRVDTGLGFSECSKMFANGRPPLLPQAVQTNLITKELCFDAFAVLHSGKTKTPVFSAERLNRGILERAKGQQRTDNFYPEARLPLAQRAQLSDYKGQHGIDRGHMVPAGDQENAQAMSQSFSLSNMIPQASQNNRGIWADIEKATRKYALRAQGDVFVITGPAFVGQFRTIGSGRVAVPTHIFKLVYDPSNGKSWAHWVQNTDEAVMSEPISYADLTNRLGFELIPGLGH